MQNVTQTVKVQAIMVMGTASLINEASKGLIKDYLRSPETEKESKKQDVMASLNPQVVKELQTLGVDSPMDTIDISLKLSEFLYDIYLSGVTPPTAPLAVKIHEKHLMKLAENLDNAEEFEFDGKFKETVKGVLENDGKWKSVELHVGVDANGTKNVVKLMSVAANMFPKVLNAALEQFSE